MEVLILKSKKQIVLSFAIVSILACYYIFSAPEARHEFTNLSFGGWILSILSFGVEALVVGWPWTVFFFDSKRRESGPPILVFSLVSVIISALYFLPPYNGPIEGRGYRCVFFLLSVWALFFLSKLAQEKK